MNTRSTTAARTAASLLAKRWLLLLQRQAPPTRNGQYALCTLECDIIHRLWDATWHDTRTRVILDDTYTVDDWMSRIVIYVIKFFGTNYGLEDRELVQWVRGNGFVDPEIDDAAWIQKEIETVEILSPFVLNLWDNDWNKENVGVAW